MIKTVTAALLLSVTAITNSACVDPNQIIRFTNSLLTRKCAWIDQVDLMRTQNIQYPIIHLGDSITANGAFQGNMGVGGDTTQLIMQRLDIVYNAHPSDVYLLVGINDFYRGATTANVFRLYNGLITQIKAQGINVHVISTLKCNTSVRPECTAINVKVDQLNQQLSAVQGIDFINLDVLLSNSGGILPKYTTDGLHLSSAGYAIMYSLMGN